MTSILRTRVIKTQLMLEEFIEKSLTQRITGYSGYLFQKKTEDFIKQFSKIHLIQYILRDRQEYYFLNVLADEYKLLLKLVYNECFNETVNHLQPIKNSEKNFLRFGLEFLRELQPSIDFHDKLYYFLLKNEFDEMILLEGKDKYECRDIYFHDFYSRWQKTSEGYWTEIFKSFSKQEEVLLDPSKIITLSISSENMKVDYESLAPALKKIIENNIAHYRNTYEKILVHVEKESFKEDTFDQYSPVYMIHFFDREKCFSRKGFCFNLKTEEWEEF